MSAIPVGYESLQGLRRKGVSLLCILLASALAMGIFVYVDSYSVHEWNNQLGQVGDVAMTAEGDNVGRWLEDIQNLPEVIKAATLRYDYGDFKLANATEWDYWFGGKIVDLTDEYIEAFPNQYKLIQGAFPADDKEIAISLSISEYGNFHLGDYLNYSLYWNYPDETWTVLEIVGIFEVANDVNYDYWWRPTAAAVVVSDLFDPYGNNLEISIEIDRTPLTPFNAGGSLSYVLGIEDKIRSVDPNYGPPYYNSRIYIDSPLATAVSRYIGWQMTMRINQVSRAAGTLLLVVLVMFLAIRHNMNERRYENNMLMSRGAAQGDIEKRVLKEIAALCFIGTILGFGIGILFSRIGLASTGFFEFNYVLFFTEPFLVTLESLILTIVIGVILPVGTWFLYNAFYSTKKKVDESTGKVEKAARILSIIRWDVIVFVLSALFLLGLLSTGQLLQYNFILSTIASMLPLAMFVSLGSLTIKALRNGAHIMSKGMNRVVGVLPSSVGVRRLGKSASSAGPAILVLVLAVSISWTYAVIGASMPLTKQNQGRFAFGGDIAFHLGSYETTDWTNFTLNVTNHESCSAASLIHRSEILLSSEYYDYAYMVGMDPSEYKFVGYDQWGNQLNGSDLAPLLDSLTTSPAGAIITSDIAESYNLAIGDTIRGFSGYYYDSEDIYVFTVVGIVNALSNSGVTNTGTDQDDYYYYYVDEIGSRTMWVNRDYLGSLISLTNETENILCVRTNPNTNGTEFVNEIMENGGRAVIPEYAWAAVSYEIDTYTSAIAYQIDRAVDTMLAISTSAIIFAAFIIYAFEGITARKREIALIRSMGGNRADVVKAQVAEMTILIFTALILLGIYGPLHIINALIGYRTSNYTFPVTVFPIFPLYTMLSVLLFFVGSAIIFVIAVAMLSSRVKLAEALNATWAESGPYGGDM